MAKKMYMLSLEILEARLDRNDIVVAECIEVLAFDCVLNLEHSLNANIQKYITC